MTGPLPTAGHQRRQRGSSAPSLSHSSPALSFPHFFFPSPFFDSPPCDAPLARQMKGETQTRPSITRLVTPPSSFLSARRLQKACNYGLRCKRREHPSTPSLIHLTLAACGGLTPSLIENRCARNAGEEGGGPAVWRRTALLMFNQTCSLQQQKKIDNAYKQSAAPVVEGRPSAAGGRRDCFRCCCVSGPLGHLSISSSAALLLLTVPNTGGDCAALIVWERVNETERKCTIAHDCMVKT